MEVVAHLVVPASLVDVAMVMAAVVIVVVLVLDRLLGAGMDFALVQRWPLSAMPPRRN